MADRVAVISDIHGNITALQAVLADIEARGITTIYNLGDVIGKGPRGRESVRISRQRCALTIRGNWDDHIDIPQPHWGQAMFWWRAELTPEDRRWLSTLPLCHDILISGRRVRMFHASARSVHHRVMSRHSVEEFEAMFVATELTGDGPSPDLVIYGDIHGAYVTSRRSRTLVNAGSVGNPLDEPTAAYLILEGEVDAPEPAPFSLQIMRVPYDIEAEIAVAADLDMPELDAYAIELRTAVYRAFHEQLGLSADL